MTLIDFDWFGNEIQISMNINVYKNKFNGNNTSNKTLMK